MAARYRKPRIVTAGLTLAILIGAPAAVFAQDSLKRAKDLYAAASYEEALQLLDTIKDSTPSTEASAYSVFCLVALGRKDEAKAAMEAIYKADPLSRPPDGLVSPRIRSFFDDVRRPHVPVAARDSYAKGKAAYDRKDWSAAVSEFDRAIMLADEAFAIDPSVGDLKTLAGGFRDLARAALAPKPTPAATAAAPAPAPAAPGVYGPVQAQRGKAGSGAQAAANVAAVAARSEDELLRRDRVDHRRAGQ